MERGIFTFVVFSLLGIVTGCSNTKTYVYDLTVKNNTSQPVSLWMVKDGPPDEKGWPKPEKFALSAPAHEERIRGVVLPPGKTATKMSEGKFDPGVAAWLRVYIGKHEFSELLAMSKGSPNRMEIPLDPGVNRITLKEVGGKIVAVHDESDAPSQAAAK